MDYLELIALPPKDTFNKGLTSPRNADMLGFFGHPVVGGQYDPKGKCKAPDNPDFKKRLETRNVGPLKVTGLKPALDSLVSIFSRVNLEVPDLYAILKTQGMLCSRYTKINGRIGPSISNHSWGTALDVQLESDLDPQGDGKIQRGLLILSTYFNSAGWYWGAAFPVEDGMHFEVSKGLLANWKKAGLI
ncbi:M15 family metallopeptidase [Pseudomonas sp. SIMBA_041]|uniref:M15 family metallopeptidase n=1 Tax=Pseudomonas sp. SIMBA_041 TaxID=3085782 RepID=UPI00397B25EB